MTNEPTPQQKRWQQQQAAEHEASLRKLNGIFQFWTVCPDKRCRRERACCGAYFSCFRRFWPHVREENKVHFRACLKALEQGHSPEEAAAIARAKVARFAALQAELGPSEPASKPAARVYP